MRDNNIILENLFRDLFKTNEVRLIPTTIAIWERAAHLRANTGMKTPDALHAATALAVGCTDFITNDVNFRRVSGLSVTILGDLIKDE